MRFFIDEDLSPSLVEICNGAGYEATCCRDRGMLSATDREVAELCMDEERVLVTNNATDFLNLATAAGLHPGLVVMPLAGRRRTREWMAVAIARIEEQAVADGSEAAVLMVNRVMEVEGNACHDYEFP